MTTQNNAAQPVLTDTQIENIRIRAEKDSRRFGRTVDIPLQADLLLALLSKLRAPVPDGKRPDLDWIEGVRVTDTVGRGWCVRIDGTDIYEDANRYGCKGRKSFQIASGLSNKQEAEHVALEWLDRQRAALASAPVADERAALQRIVETAEDGANSGDRHARCVEIARATLASAPLAGEAQPVAECERCGLAPEDHTELHWCDNQSFRLGDAVQLGAAPQASAYGHKPEPLDTSPGHSAPQAPAGWRWTLHPAGLHPDVYAAAAARDSAEDVRTDKERK